MDATGVTRNVRETGIPEIQVLCGMRPSRLVSYFQRLGGASDSTFVV